jgi:hypothetical protein
MEKCEHKRQGKHDGTGKRNDFRDHEKLTDKKIWPGKNQQNWDRKSPVNKADSQIIFLAQLSASHGTFQFVLPLQLFAKLCLIRSRSKLAANLP